MMFYTTVAGWMLRYFVDMAIGKFEGANPEQVGKLFSQMLASPLEMTVYMAVVVIASFAVCAIGLQNGLEKITKVMMIALLVIMLVLAVNSVFLPGAKEGLKFYLIPDFAKMKESGVFNVVVAAMNQAFFTLSLGIGAMAIFGSYIGNNQSLMGEAVNVAFLDTFVAFASGLIIFPACFAYNVQPDSGPSLIFITLPNIFNHMPFGRLWGSLFFVFMSFAAVSTVLAVFENIISCTRDLFHISRAKACVINCILILLLSMPCVLGFNIWSNIQPLGAGSGILDFEDFIVSNILLPLGALVYTIFCVSKYGWGFEKFKTEANKGDGIKVKDYMRFYMTYILPFMILCIFLLGLYSFFNK